LTRARSLHTHGDLLRSPAHAGLFCRTSGAEAIAPVEAKVLRHADSNPEDVEEEEEEGEEEGAKGEGRLIEVVGNR